MSEVKRYGRIGDMIEATEGLIKLYPMMSVYLLAADFDRVAAERDAALGREAALNLQISNQTETIKQLSGRYGPIAEALQQRMTAADERNDSRDCEILAQVQSALRRSFSLGQIYWQQADSDSTCQQNKSDQTMEIQEQHILNVLKSLGAALKPAEGGGDDTTIQEEREDAKKVFVRTNTKQGQNVSLADMQARYETKP